MTHANAPLTPVGRLRLACLIVDQSWSVRRAAERFQVSPATASRWASRHRAGLPMTDVSSRPHRSPNRTSRRLERRIVALRFSRRWGPHRIGYHLRIARSTVEQVLARYRMPRLPRELRDPLPRQMPAQQPGALPCARLVLRCIGQPTTSHFLHNTQCYRDRRLDARACGSQRMSGAPPHTGV